MAERYTRLCKLPKTDLYETGAPLLLCAGALLKDTQTGKVIAQLKFRNIGEKRIKAVKVSIRAFDAFGTEVEGIPEYQYLDLSVGRDAEFGQKTAIIMPNAETRSFACTIKSAIFSDGTTWTAQTDEWEPLKEQKTLQERFGALAGQYCRDTFKAAEYAPDTERDLWRCACGAINREAETTCHNCGATRETLFAAADPKTLKAHDEAHQRLLAKQAEEARIEKEKNGKKRKKILTIVVFPTIIACIAFVIMLTTVIIPNQKYNAAAELYNSGKYEEAIAAFEAMDGYRDSTEQIKKCETAIKDEKYADAFELYTAGKYEDAIAAFTALGEYKDSLAQIEKCEAKIIREGSTIFFGSYEQDNNTSNGKEDIEWLVLAKEGKRILIVSKFALDCQRYNSSQTDTTWEACSLRKWLNETFLNAAFSSDEQNCIFSSTVTADNNPSYSTSPGKNTIDKVFLLSITEVSKYFNSDEARKCVPTDYAIARGAYTSSSYSTGGRALCWWWLRSPGYSSCSAALVNYVGAVDRGGNRVDGNSDAVRPAMWIEYRED